MAEHGYGRYTNGCRCEICRSAKAAYMLGKRHRAARLRSAATTLGQRYVAQGITHGYTGYQDHQCRCGVCTTARSRWDAEHPRRKVSG